jgi:hypothetical protein
MSKERKGNKEVKKPKVKDDGSKKQKKDPQRYDSNVSKVFRKAHDQNSPGS